MAPLAPAASDGSPSHRTWLQGVPPPDVYVPPALSEKEKPLFAATAPCCPSLVATSSSPTPAWTWIGTPFDGLFPRGPFCCRSGDCRGLTGLGARCPIIESSRCETAALPLGTFMF